MVIESGWLMWVPAVGSNLGGRLFKNYYGALYDRIDLLPVCMREFHAFLDEVTLQFVQDLQAQMGARRKKVDFILRVANRFLRALGFRVMPLQWK